jgi:hypothetical protein
MTDKFQNKWQSRFYDHIIRDDKSFQRISDYIINNPAKWQEDVFLNHKKIMMANDQTQLG